MADAHELLITYVDGKRFAVHVSRIFEVINSVETTTFIDRPDNIIGLINLRGEIVPVHDMRFYTNSPRREMIATDYIVILLEGDTKIGIAVDSVDTVKIFQEEQLFAQSLSPNAFKFINIKDRKVLFEEIRTMLES